VLLVTFSGNDFDLKVGPITLVEMVVAAVRTLSGSTRILGRFGAMSARMLTISSARLGVDRSSFSELASRKPMGLVVNIAVRSRRNKS